jgi:exopolysaccharide biosynthesis polyprenyl glycosylphosphotransferase
MKRSEIFFGVLKIAVDFTATILAFLLAYKLRLLTDSIPGIAKPVDIGSFLSVSDYLRFSWHSALLLVAVFTLGGMYTLKAKVTFSKETKKIIALSAFWIALIIAYFFFKRIVPFSRLAFIYCFVLTILAVILGRILIKLLQKLTFKLGFGKQRVLILGNNTIAAEIEKKLAKKDIYQIVGTLDDISNLGKFTSEKKLDEIIQTQRNLSEKNAEDILKFCEEHHVEYSFVPDLLEVQRTNVEIKTLGTIPIITLKKTPLDGWGRVAKRIADILGALIGLILLSPIFLIIAVVIKIDSKGPVFFSRLDDGTPAKRVGKGGKFFRCFKFRSMYPNTHTLRYSKELEDKNLRAGTPLVKIKDDPRVTRVGRFIRKYSLDELPQLWNVLIGNMSLVGPRPHLPEEVEKYQNHHKFVLTIKPGLTGLPQTSGRSDLDFETEVKLDRYYIEHWSTWFDIKLIFKTIGILLKGYKE